MVDDRPANLLALEAILAELGETLVRAGSGEEALRRIVRQELAVILLDVQMPGLNGVETAQRVRASTAPETPPIIFLSAAESDEFPVVEAYRLGAVDYLLKPPVPDSRLLPREGAGREQPTDRHPARTGRSPLASSGRSSRAPGPDTSRPSWH